MEKGVEIVRAMPLIGEQYFFGRKGENIIICIMRLEFRTKGKFCFTDHSTANGILDLIATQGVALGYYYGPSGLKMQLRT